MFGDTQLPTADLFIRFNQSLTRADVQWTGEPFFRGDLPTFTPTVEQHCRSIRRHKEIFANWPGV